LAGKPKRPIGRSAVPESPREEVENRLEIVRTWGPAVLDPYKDKRNPGKGLRYRGKSKSTGRIACATKPGAEE